MHEINRVLKKAAWRVGITNFLRAWVYAAAAVLAAAILLRIVEQLLAFTDLSPGPGSTRPVSGAMWMQVLQWGLAAIVLFALVWSIARRPRPGAVARRVDEGANLRESLSTALCIAGHDDPWSRATVESARRTARGVNVAQAVPISAPRSWPVVVALALAFAVVYLALPRMDVLGWFDKATVARKVEADKINAITEVKAVEKKIEELTSKIPSLEKEKPGDPSAAEKPEPKTAEEIRKAALSNLTKLTDRLEELKSGAAAKKLEAIENQLKNLKQVPGETGELSKSLAKGDFSQAKQELEKMKDKMASGDMSPEAKEKMAEQMKSLAEQLDKLAKNQDQMKKALEQAGINPESIKDPASAKEAIKNAQNLSDEQKKAMEQALEAAMQSTEAMQQMAAAMQKMSEGMKQSQGEGQQGQEGQKQAADAAAQMAEQMSQMEQMQQEMEMAEATMNEAQQAMQQLGQQGEGDQQGMGECKNGMGGGKDGMRGNESTKPWSAGVTDNEGGGRGGPGRGEGGRPGEAKADFELEKKKFIGAKGDGPIISSRLVEGESIRGESRAAFVTAVASGDQNATEAMENNTIPREYHDAIKAYFGRLKSKAQKDAAGKDASKDAKPAEPAAAPAKDGDDK